MEMLSSVKYRRGAITQCPEEEKQMILPSRGHKKPQVYETGSHHVAQACLEFAI